MAYVSVADWKPEQVTEWLKGLDNCLLPYLHWFSNNEISGQQLLNLCPDELTHLGVQKIGHQELILEGLHYLRNFHYELDRENLQALALRVACSAHSLFAEARDISELQSVPTQIMSDLANVVNHVKTLVSWLDRAPFAGQLEYLDLKPQLLGHCLEMATSASRDKFAERPVAIIRDCAERLAKLADSIIQGGSDPMILQPASLDLATLKKRAGEDLGFFLVPSYHGEHQVGDMKLSSPAHQSGKIQAGDEVVQVNYQTVVGWSRKKVLVLFEESPNDLLLTLKRRPRHVKMYGQMYMKPYRLPSRKRVAAYTRWNENLPSPRPEFLTIPHFQLPSRKKVELKQPLLVDSVTSSSSSDEEFPPPLSTSPTSMRLYLPKPRAPIQRRFTLSGPPRPSAQTEQFWRELQLERSWRSNQNNSQTGNQKDGSKSPLRGKSVSDGAAVAALDKSAEKSAANDARSIIELNKVKRDAFFSNMGCPPKPVPPRGRLDKSRSTPAYDLGEPETRDHSPCTDGEGRPKPINIAATKNWGNESPRDLQTLATSSGTDKTRNATQFEAMDPRLDFLVDKPSNEPEHGQMVVTINQTLRRDHEEDSFFTDVPPAPREIRPIPAQRKLALPPAPLPPKPKPRPLPPEPPPRPDLPPPPNSPSTPILSVTTERERTKNTLDHLKAMWTLGRTSSPRTTRKHSAVLARRRQVAVKDLLPGDVSGALWHRKRRGQAGWTQGFFLLQGPAFYGFRHRDRSRADLFIFLPGFTCSLAEEVKSRNHAFKIYHTGTVFYFAAESEEELQQWMDSTSLATTSNEEGRAGDTTGWSETDSESSDTEPPPDSCFPTKSKLLGASARSHQNLAADTNKCESPRKFGSLKKLSGGGKSVVEGPEAASLDRKCLRFLTQKASPVPVPTSQFRSYRRMQPPTAPPRLSPGVVPSVLIDVGVDSAGRFSTRLSRRTLHSSNPSLIHPDMADYRMTQERLREFRNLRNQGRPVDLSGFMTLEQFMLSRQEEERSLRSARQTRTRVFPSQPRDPVPEPSRRVLDSSSSDASDKPQVMPRNKMPGVKIKLQSAPTFHGSSSDEAVSESRRSKQLPPKPPQSAAALPEYPGIEYPPAFEPETYTLQYMLKNRRKRDAANK